MEFIFFDKWRLDERKQGRVLRVSGVRTSTGTINALLSCVFRVEDQIQPDMTYSHP